MDFLSDGTVEVIGVDGDGKMYLSAEEVWEQEFSGSSEESKAKKDKWFNQSVAYWSAVEASNNGVLGGFGIVNDKDIRDSNMFFASLPSFGLHVNFQGNAAGMSHVYITICIVYIYEYLHTYI